MGGKPVSLARLSCQYGIVMAALLGWCIGQAQEAGPPAAAAQKMTFDIAAQSIGAAVEELGRQSGLTVVIDATLGHRAMAPKVSGQYTAIEALKLLLGSSGLRAVYLDAHTIMVVAGDSTAESSDRLIRGDIKAVNPPDPPST